MRLVAGLAIALVVLSATTPGVYAGKKKTVYLGQEIGNIPACTPVQMVNTGRVGRPGYKPKYAGDPLGPVPTTIRDLNDRWGRIEIQFERYESFDQYDTISDCIQSVGSYTDRYLPDHLELMERGELIAGMPAEFARITMGKPDSLRRPVIGSRINPVTGEAERFIRYTWTDLGKRGMWATVFGVITVAAAGVAATTESLGTAVDAVNVAAVSSVTSSALTASAIANATVVTVEVDSNNQIRVVTIGGL